MLISTTTDVPGYEIAKVFGLVRGSRVNTSDIHSRSRFSVKGSDGNELIETGQLGTGDKDEVIRRLVASANAAGANAIVAKRFDPIQRVR
jgi:uncharacterized protein YbjQ (UPF0145 family)